MSLQIGQLWRSGRDRLVASGHDNAVLDARLLAQHALGLDTTALVAREREPVASEGVARFQALIDRRLAGEPVARIVGRQEFYGLSFALAPSTLVPRPETEMLVDFALAVLPADRPVRILDLGTGTGCIALAILANRPLAMATGVELSTEAAAQARANGASLGLGGRWSVLEGSWFAPVRHQIFDLVVANPPYIESAVMGGLAPEVRLFDPARALDGGADGLEPYRAIAAGLPAHLAPGAAVALEIGTGQGEAVAALIVGAGLDAVAVAHDLAGHQRMVTARASQ